MDACHEDEEWQGLLGRREGDDFTGPRMQAQTGDIFGDSVQTVATSEAIHLFSGLADKSTEFFLV